MMSGTVCEVDYISVVKLGDCRVQDEDLNALQILTLLCSFWSSSGRPVVIISEANLNYFPIMGII